MILVTVGTQLPFDRLVKEADRWAQVRGEEVLAQTGRSKWVPRFIKAVPFLEPTDLEEEMRRATAIVSHAGMGTILSALFLKKPILIMPRRARLGEHDSDHQLATVKHFAGKPGILVAMDEAELFERLDELRCATLPEGISKYASIALIEALRNYLDG